MGSAGETDEDRSEDEEEDKDTRKRNSNDRRSWKRVVILVVSIVVL